MQYLLMSEEEFSKLCLGEKEQLLWKSARRLEAGENPRTVALTLIESGLITKNDLKLFKKWIKSLPKKTPTLNALQKRGRLWSLDKEWRGNLGHITIPFPKILFIVEKHIKTFPPYFPQPSQKGGLDTALLFFWKNLDIPTEPNYPSLALSILRRILCNPINRIVNSN